LARLNIAVVGSGISGLSAAWLLSRSHDVTLYEAEDRLGGHSNTVDCGVGGVPVAVDTGFIVYNEATYPNLTALFDLLGVPTADASMGFSVSLAGGRSEYSGNSALKMLGNARNLADLDHWRMLRDLVRFFRSAGSRAKSLGDRVTLGQFAAAEGYSQAFVERHLLPMAGAIWSSAPRQMLDYPARPFLTFFDNHGLLKFVDRPQWRTVVGGSRAYVAKLVADSSAKILPGSAVKSISRAPGRITVCTATGARRDFDHVVIATHADQALGMLTEPTAGERRCLAPFTYARNRAVLHRDETLMPRRRRLWSSWNYLSVKNGTESGCTVTYWMNSLQPLGTPTNFFVTLNPQSEPAAGTIEREFQYEHPIFTPETARMQRELWSLQGQRNTWFCGAYFGAGFHEDGLQAGLAVGEQLGGVKRPWRLADPSSRIHVGPPATASLPAEAAE
jgi:hypothetical protein